MTLTFTRGNIFDSSAQTLVNPVNCVGVSGKGLAKEFKKRFPEAQRGYERTCKWGNLNIGRLLFYSDQSRVVLFFPTRRHWRDPSEVSFIEAGLETFARVYDEEARDEIFSVAFPALGCGNGGLDWADVKPLMTRYLEPLPIPVTVFEPGER